MGPQPGALRSLQETAPPPGYRQARVGGGAGPLLRHGRRNGLRLD